MKDRTYKLLTESGTDANEDFRMSVQAGVWNFDGKPVDQRVVQRISESMQQQGPDDEFIYIKGSIALLYRPFHTTRDSRREKQPRVSRRGFVITWDGRLDNRDELISKHSNDIKEVEPTDVDIVASVFDRYGTDGFRYIIGDWAIAIWKPAQNELILACDFMSIRHIFYQLTNDRLWWATDLTPLVLLSGESYSVDDEYIAGYFASDPDSHLTPFREIRQVPAGRFVRVRRGKASVERYWYFTAKSRIRYTTDAKYEEHFRELFRRAVRRRLRSDLPILAELSGGLDSSSIVCVADAILAKDEVQVPRLDTISYYDTTEPNGDDLLYFQRVEKRRGRIGIHIDASTYGEASTFDYPEFYPLPGYVGTSRKLQLQRAAATTKGQHRVMLSGIGGDEFLGGVPNPSVQLADLIVQLRFIKAARQFTAWSLIKRKPWILLLRDALVELLPVSLRQYFTEVARVEPWIDREFARTTRIAIRQFGAPEYFNMWLPSRRSDVGVAMAMANKMSKRNVRPSPPVETRYCYLDQNLIEFILSIPANQLLRPGERRSLMRRALVGLVPEEILSRRTKQLGARTPIVALQNNVGVLRRAFESPFLSRCGFIDRNRFIQTLEGASSGKTARLGRLFKAISLEFWLRDLVSRKLNLRLPEFDLKH